MATAVYLCAFRVAANMRKRTMAHIMTLPIGFLDSLGGGNPPATLAVTIWHYYFTNYYQRNARLARPGIVVRR